MKKTVNISGESKKVNFEMTEKVIMNKEVRGGTNSDSLITLIIDGKEYKDSFIKYFRINPKNHKYSVTFESTKTGKTFGDSHKKLVEYLLN